MTGARAGGRDGSRRTRPREPALAAGRSASIAGPPFRAGVAAGDGTPHAPAVGSTFGALVRVVRALPPDDDCWLLAVEALPDGPMFYAVATEAPRRSS